MKRQLKQFLSKRRNRTVAALVAAALVGALCRFLPVALQGPCHTCAKILTLLVGG